MFSFIILHYKNIEDTVKCLKTIKTNINGHYNLVVVDNNTLKKDEEKELHKYTNDILKLNKNYGYAKANNIGIKYAKDKYKSNFYIVINNDVFISQHNFLDIIIKDYDAYEFDMLGPSISSPSNESVNPFPVIKTKEEINYQISKANKLIKIYENPLSYLLLKIYLKVKYMIVKKKITNNGEQLQKNVALHGCAIIFSNKYINKYEYPFYNNTFLFHEEEFLYQRIIKDNLTSIYDPKLSVFHQEGSSIRENKNERKSKLFREKERIKSLKLLLEEISDTSR